MRGRALQPNQLSYSSAISASEKASAKLWDLALKLSTLTVPDVVSHSASCRERTREASHRGHHQCPARSGQVDLGA